MTDLTDALARSLAMLRAGWTATDLNRINRRAREAQERQMATDKTATILDRLTTAHGVINQYEFGFGDDSEYGFTDAPDVLASIVDLPEGNVTEFVTTLAGLAVLLSDAGAEIARLSAENAGLRAREGR